MSNPEQEKDADRIRQHVLTHYIEPARARGDIHADVTVRDVQKALGIAQGSHPNVVQALKGRKMQQLTGEPAPEHIGGGLDSPATEFRFHLQRISQMSGTKPVNRIFYGPPGTGKTYRTAEEALRLCGEKVPKERKALMQKYEQLRSQGRIVFVTFHQSTSYEDFVEGRHPETGSDETGESAGFRLVTKHGIFRQIAGQASKGQGSINAEGKADSAENESFFADRKIFKMSIGEASSAKDKPLFEESVRDEYALLDFDNIDWSHRKYDDPEEMKKRLKIGNEGDLNAREGRVKMSILFRTGINPGDIIVVSKGNEFFRAIGEVTGGYEYHPREDKRYHHRIPVKWHWINREGESFSKICSKVFTQMTLYELKKDQLKLPALQEYISQNPSDESDPQHAKSADQKPYVLIIDEINRANISRVFGELITLLEPDKRLGAVNEIRVRLPYSNDEFGVPSNLHILGTMNTADRSIALLDTALRRRFEFTELMPKPEQLADAAQKTGVKLPGVLQTINERIEYLYDREHQLGHAYFMGCRSKDDLDAVMRNRVIPLLAEYFFEDWNKVALVLGDATDSDQASHTGSFLKRSRLKAPPGQETEISARYRWEVRSGVFDYTALEKA